MPQTWGMLLGKSDRRQAANCFGWLALTHFIVFQIGLAADRIDGEPLEGEVEFHFILSCQRRFGGHGLSGQEWSQGLAASRAQ